MTVPEQIGMTMWRPEQCAHAPQIGTRLRVPPSNYVEWTRHPIVSATKAVGLYSLATFAGDVRRKSSVERVYALALDVDDGSLTVDRAAELLSPYWVVVYETHSSTAERLKLRAVLMLSRGVTLTEYESIWPVVAEHMTAIGVTLDRATRDGSRGWYLPARPQGAGYAHHHHDGRAIDVDALLATAAEIAAEEEAAAERAREEHARQREEAKKKREAEGKTEPDPREIALAYLDKIDGAISGQHGHNTTFRAACFIVANFDASEHMPLMRRYNDRCRPKWSEAELKKKIKDAEKKNPKPMELRA